MFEETFVQNARFGSTGREKKTIDERRLAGKYPPDISPAVGVPGVIADVGGASFHQPVDGKTTKASNSEAATIGDCDSSLDAIVPKARSGGGKLSMKDSRTKFGVPKPCCADKIATD